LAKEKDERKRKKTWWGMDLGIGSTDHTCVLIAELEGENRKW